jgi:hypothetical protein
MIELQPNEFGAAFCLFDEIDHSAALVHSILEGNSPGRVFVDRRAAPSAAYLVHKGAFHYVAGSPADREFSQALVPLIFDDLPLDRGSRSWSCSRSPRLGGTNSTCC